MIAENGDGDGDGGEVRGDGRVVNGDGGEVEGEETEEIVGLYRVSEIQLMFV